MLREDKELAGRSRIASGQTLPWASSPPPATPVVDDAAFLGFPEDGEHRQSKSGSGGRELRGLLLFDFDGTLYRGDAPFRFYAREIAQAMASSQRDTYLNQVHAHLDGQPGVVAGDNWEAVVKLALPYVQDGETFNNAFLATRTYMMSDECELEVPVELRRFLDRARGQVVLAVASNSPEQAALPLLDKLALLQSFDIVRHSTGKPAGLLPLADDIIEQYGLNPRLVMSIGDHYVNDIAPALERGWVTAHISPRGYHPGPSTYQGRQLEDVLPYARAWLATAAD